MKLASFTLNPIGSNCYVVSSEQTKAALIIDPNGIDMSPVFEYVDKEDLTVEAILCTHGHFDHVLGNDVTRDTYQVPLYLHPDDLEWLELAPQRVMQYLKKQIVCRPPDQLLADEQELSFQDLTVRVMHTPGHSKGSVCFLINGHLMAGDTLFANTVGRTDLPGGSQEELIESIRVKLWSLPDDTIVYPGHMETTTIGQEKKFNLYLQDL